MRITSKRFRLASTAGDGAADVVLANTFPQRYKTALARMLAAVPPETMGSWRSVTR
jgi:hypothetical protein